MRTAYLFQFNVVVFTLLFLPYALTADPTKDISVENENLFLLEVDDVSDKDSVRLAVVGNIDMKDTTSPSVGNIVKNGVRFIHNFGTDNTFVGKYAGRNDGNITNIGSSNSGFGFSALRRLTTGISNTAAGFNALRRNRTGSRNTAVGSSALFDNRTGFDNVAVGFAALASNMAGTGNTAIGTSALNANVSGADNIAIGRQALLNNISGIQNIAVGNDALGGESSNNIAIGHLALASSSKKPGTSNIAIGNNALANGAGSNNTAIGHGSGVSNSNENITIGNFAGSAIGTGDNNIMIGNGVGVKNDTNTIRIGSNQRKTFIAGIRGTAVLGGKPVSIDSAGQLGTNTSSKKYKNSIRAMNNSDSDSIHSLKPVTFVYNEDPTKTMQYGLIAEEVDEVFPGLVIRGENDEPFSVRYEILPVLLLNEIKQQRQEINQMKQDMNLVPQLRQAIADLQEKMVRFIAS